MSRPPLEVADIVRSAGAAFIERNRQWIGWKHVKVLLAIARCRTAALGGHVDECTRCGHRATISYNSCRDRHCPKCQIAAREKWIAARQKELLPTRYLHVVFTLPRRLAPLVLQNKKVIYDLLFRTSAETLLEVARDPRLLGAELGFFSVLHTWSQQLRIHPHVHCVIPAGGLSPDHTHWIRSREKYFLPKAVLAEVFRGKFVDALKQAFQGGQLNFQANLKLLAQPKIFAAWLRPLHRQDWVVYLKQPFGGPEYVLQYLGRYTHRVAISNHRLVSFQDGQVTFRWRDSAHHNQQKLRALPVDKFLRRFLLHILPQGFVRIRQPPARHDSAALLSVAGRGTPTIRVFLRRFPPPLSLPQMRRTNEGHRTAHGCRPSTSLSSRGHRCGMKRLSPNPKLRAPARSALLCLTANTTLPLPSLTHRFVALFLAHPPLRASRLPVALRSTASAHLRAALSHL